MSLRKIIMVILLAYFVSRIILWTVYDIPPSTTDAIIIACYAAFSVARDFFWQLYIEIYKPKILRDE